MTSPGMPIFWWTLHRATQGALFVDLRKGLCLRKIYKQEVGPFSALMVLFCKLSNCVYHTCTSSPYWNPHCMWLKKSLLSYISLVASSVTPLPVSSRKYPSEQYPSNCHNISNILSWEYIGTSTKSAQSWSTLLSLHKHCKRSMRKARNFLSAHPAFTISAWRRPDLPAAFPDMCSTTSSHVGDFSVPSYQASIFPSPLHNHSYWSGCEHLLLAGSVFSISPVGLRWWCKALEHHH